MQAKVVDSNGIKNLVTAEEFQTLLNGGIIQIAEDQEYIQLFGYNNTIYQESSYATAYLINNDGYLLTNAHAVDLLRIKTVDSLFIILSIEPFKIIPAEIIWSSWQEASSDDMREDTRHDGRMIPYGYSDLAVIRVSPSSLNVPPLKFAKFDFDEIFRYDYDKRTKSTRPLLSRGIGFPASSDIMYGELNNQQLFEKPKISSGEINDLNFVENMTFDHYYYLISTNSSGHGNSGEPIVNMCGEILGTVFSGTELFSFEDLMGNDSFFIPLPYTFEQLDKLKINYDVLNEPCASSDIIEYESIGQRAFQRGLTFYNDKNYTKAVALFAKAIQEDPQYSDALYYRGVSYSFLKEYDNSIQDLNQVIKILPNSANAYYTRGRSFYFNDQYEEAINDITKYLEMEPNDPSGNNLLGWIYYTIGDNEKAVEFATISINLKSDFGAAYDTRGQAYFALGQNEKAIEDALKACEFGECDFRNKLKDLNLL
jgi:tetratricopeptide (TPR) repeat protein